MTEQEWSTATDPTPMLVFLRTRGRAGDRTLRLFACGCCRRQWASLTEEGRGAVAVAEQFADRGAAEVERGAAERAVRQEVQERGSSIAWASAGPVARDPDWGAWCAARNAAWGVADPTQERVQQVALLRDLFGNPFRPVQLDPSLRTWNDATLPRLARAIYGDRLLPEGTFDPQRLAVLGDALEAAGCSDPAILGHLRGEGPHVRGCWVVDLLLNKT